MRDHKALRRLAAVLVRGPGAAFILADLDDAMERDLARGVPLWSARWRYAANALGSARSLRCARWRSAVRAAGAALGVRRRRWVPSLGVSWLDVKLGLRMLVQQPGLTGVAVFALAVGIPLGLAPMHFVRAVQAPLPFDEGDRVRVLRNVNVATSRTETPSLYDFVRWREELTSFDALGAATIRTSYNVISEDGRAAPVSGAAVTSSMFDILRVGPLLGRTLTAADDVIAAPNVVVLGYDLWQSRLHGDPEVVGRAIRIGGVPHTVVGVMPKEFVFPMRDHLWLPLRVSVLADEHGQGLSYRIFGRLADGISPEEAQAELATAGRRMAVAFPELHERLHPEVVPFAIGFFGLPKGGMQTEIGFYVVQVLTLLLLVVACANVGMLILARTASRSGELALRTALGANRTRILSQLFTEALVFAVLAAGVGLLASHQIASRLVLQDMLPFWVDLGATPETVFSALSLAALSAGVVAVVPALKVTGQAVQRSLQRAAASKSGVRFGGMSSAIVVANVTLAVATLSLAAGLSEGLTEVPDGMGIEPEQFLYARLRIPRIEPADGTTAFDSAEFAARVRRAQQELTRRLAAEPGIRGVAVGSHLPGMDHPGRRVELESESRSDKVEGHRVFSAQVDLGFFDALEQPIRIGRGFDMLDLGGDSSAVIVNTNFVDRVLDGRNPIGRRLRYRGSAAEEAGSWHEIVGVVGHLGMNVAFPGRDAGIYHPMAPGYHPVRFAIHVGDDPESLTPRLRALASEVDPAAMIQDPMALSKVFSFDGFTVAWAKRGAAILIGVLVALSASGVYALMSFTIAQREREIGIRTALGARWSRVVSTIARRSLAQLGIGALLGLALAGRLLSELKHDLGRIPTHSPFVVALIASVSVIVVIAALACTVPTLRALKIRPAEVLKAGGG